MVVPPKSVNSPGKSYTELNVRYWVTADKRRFLARYGLSAYDRLCDIVDRNCGLSAFDPTATLNSNSMH